jgi:hypothetical protein
MGITLKDYLEEHLPKGFNSRPLYFKEGDFVSYFIEDRPYFAERVDELLTIYRAMDDHEHIVGCKIKGISHLVERLGSFGVQVEDENGNILLGLLFVGCQAFAVKPTTMQPEERQHKYEEVRPMGKATLSRQEMQPA